MTATTITCRLGRLRPTSFADAVRELQAAFTGVHEEPLAPEADVDLRHVVRGTRDEAWVDEIHDVLTARTDTALLACVHAPSGDGATLVVAAGLASRGDVRRGDTIVAGFAALRDGDADVQLWPRHVRCVCANGVVQPTRYGEDLVAQGRTPADAAGECLSPDGVDAAARAFGHMTVHALTPVEVRALLAELPDAATRARVEALLSARGRSSPGVGRLAARTLRLAREDGADIAWRSLRPRLRGSDRRRMESEELVTRLGELDATPVLQLMNAFFAGPDDDDAHDLWEVYNAITQTARDLGDVRARVDLERIGARLIRPLLEDDGLAGPTARELVARAPTTVGA